MTTAPQGVMERVNGVFLLPHEWEIVASILRRHIPGRRVWAFGSRATGVRLKRFSDLDLALQGKLTLQQSAKLADDFDDSVLPFKVDLLELDTAKPEFRSRIEQDFVAIQLVS